MSLRGCINLAVDQWRNELAMRRFERRQARRQAKVAKAAQNPHWTRCDELLNIAAFCCIAAFGFAMAWLALTYATAAYPEAIYIAFTALKAIGIN